MEYLSDFRSCSCGLHSRRAFARPPQPAPASTCAATSVTLANQNPYPIWIGENVSAGAILTPPGNNWQLGAGDSVNLCVPADWTSGIFWARTECNFSGTFGQDSNYADCTSASQCGQTPNAHICYGGKCVIDCSTSTGTNGNCSSLANSVCVAAAGSASGNFTAGSFCGFAGGVCRTGDCGSGLFQCQGTWDSLTADFGPETPASQFEITDTSAADGGLGAATYDVTNLAGYNNPIDVALDFTPSGTTDPACYATSCNTDLNTICPSLLQVIEPPTGSSGSLRYQQRNLSDRILRILSERGRPDVMQRGFDLRHWMQRSRQVLWQQLSITGERTGCDRPGMRYDYPRLHEPPATGAVPRHV